MYKNEQSLSHVHLGVAIKSVECNSEHFSKNSHPIICFPTKFQFQEYKQIEPVKDAMSTISPGGYLLWYECVYPVHHFR